MKYVAILVVIISLCTPLYAQDNHTINVNIARTTLRARQVVPPSPEAASLGQYGNLPMNLFTGTPNISIPLFTLAGNQLSLPISLSFNASGFKPNEYATWVGLNWTLNAGGAVTCAVKGNPDNDNNYYNGTANIGIPDQRDFFAYKDYLKDVLVGRRESQPDFYYYNFAGKAGSYIIRPDKTVFKKEKDNLLIHHKPAGSPSVTDETGVTYGFGATETTRMLLADDAEGDPPVYQSYNYVSSWFLTNMTSADGKETIIFDYHTPDAEQSLYQQMAPNKSVTYTIQTHHTNVSKTTESYTATPPTIYIKRKFLKRITLLRSGQTVSYVDIESVAGERLDKTFTEDRMVTGIKVFNRMNGLDRVVKQYSFYYGYYTNLNNIVLKNRLRLDSIREVPQDVETVASPPYKFSYYGADSNIPDINTPGIDHWGFANGSFGGRGGSLVPNVKILDGPETVGDGANREPGWEAARNTLLQQIQYPTGGYTSFEYEGHIARYYNMDQQQYIEKNVGGVRLKRMTDFSMANKEAIIREYDYKVDDGKSSGITANYFPEYLKHSTYTLYSMSLSDPYNTYNDKYTVSANSVHGLGTMQGSHIGYRQVTESRIGIENRQPLGKTVYNYSLSAIYEDKDFISNGNLERKTEYDNGGKLLFETINTWKYKPIEGFSVLKLVTEPAQSNKVFYCKKLNAVGEYTYQQYGSWESPTDCIQRKQYNVSLNADRYSIPYEEKYLEQQVQKQYDQQSASYISNTTTYTYGNSEHTYPTNTKQLTPDNEVVITRKKYAGDYVIPVGVLSDDKTAGIQLLKNKNMVGIPIEIVQYRQKGDGSNTRFINGELNIYDRNLPNQIALFRLENAVPLATVTESSINASGGFVNDSHYTPLGYFKYDGDNLIEQGRNKDIPTSYLYNYDTRYPVAEITNSSVAFVACNSFELNTDTSAAGWNGKGITFVTTGALTGKRAASFTTGATLVKAFNTTIPLKMLVTYWSKNGALTVTQNTSTVVTSIINGPTVNGWTYYAHQLPANTQQVMFGAANAIVDEIRIHPSDAEMKTYTYEPGIGMTSAMTAGRSVNYYDYDGLGRLKLVKDQQGNIVQLYNYNYGPGTAVTPVAPSLYYNNAIRTTFAKNNCTGGAIPSEITYTVPYGKYISPNSQAEADARAQKEVADSGQIYANRNGQCIFYNAETIGKFIPRTCKYEEGEPLEVKYIVPARKYSSLISQVIVDSLAAKDVADNGQGYADYNKRCSCDTFGYKFINGKCEKGVQMFNSSVRLPNGTYKCTYRFDFSDGTSTQEYSTISAKPCPVL